MNHEMILICYQAVKMLLSNCYHAASFRYSPTLSSTPTSTLAITSTTFKQSSSSAGVTSIKSQKQECRESVTRPGNDQTRARVAHITYERPTLDIVQQCLCHTWPGRLHFINCIPSDPDQIYRVVFQLFFQIVRTKMENKLQPTRATFSRNLQSIKLLLG